MKRILFNIYTHTRKIIIVTTSEVVKQFLVLQLTVYHDWPCSIQFIPRLVDH